MLTLPPDEIHLWFAFDGDVSDPGLLDRYRDLMTEEERARQQRFRFSKHRRQYAITRALVRTVLSRYAAIPPAGWRFVANDHGRPAIAPELDPDQALTFNLSHTEGLILCGVAHARALGVDVENTASREPNIDIADRFFSAIEARDLRALPPSRQQEGFFRYWTLKESYIKAKGKGLAIPLGKFSFSAPDSPSIGIAFAPDWDDVPAAWRFWHLRPSPQHMGAVCVRHLEGVEQRLVMRRVVPLATEAPFDCPVLGRS